MKKVNLVIDKEGAVQMETVGFQGTSCREYTDRFKTALGGEIVHDETTPEGYEQAHTEINQGQE